MEEQVLTPFWARVIKYGPAMIVGLFYITIVLHYTYTPDETYIYLQYAKNFASGDGFSFNADTQSYGISGPLWVLLIAAGTRAGLDPFIVAKTFDILFASLSIVLVYTIAFTIIRDKIYSFFAALVFSLDAWLLRWSGSGMETSFAIILVLLTVKYAYLGEYHIAGFVSGMLTLVLPEGILLFLLIQSENFILSYVLGRNKKLFWIAAALYLLVVVPWLIISYRIFGSIIPNTETARTAVHWSLRGAVGSMFDSVEILCTTLPLLLILLIVGIPFVIKQGGIGTFIAKGMPALWIFGLVCGYAVLNTQVVSRHLLPVVPLIIIYALWCLKPMAESFGWSARKALVVLSAIALGTILQSQAVYRLRVVPQMKAFAGGMEQGIKPIAFWLRSNSSIDASVLTPDVGMMGYIANRRIFDTAGLITPAVKEAFDGMSYDDGMKQHLFRTIIKPDYIVDRAPVESRLASDSLRPIMITEFDNPGLRNSVPIYYTLYEVLR